LDRSKEAKVILTNLGKQGFETVKVYLLLSMAADKDENLLLTNKYKAMAFVDYMRSKE